MPLHHAVLALLAAKPAHGYELKGGFEQAVGEQWGGLNIGHLYQILDRLVHRLTPAGRAELDRWLAEPSLRAHGYRDDFFLKVMAAAQAGDPATLAGVLSRQRGHLLRELRSLAEARTLTTSSPVVSLLITAAELHVRADLGVVDAAEKTLGSEELAALRFAASGAADETEAGTAGGAGAADEATGTGAQAHTR